MNVLDRAQNFSGGPVAAARQRDRWARAEANATDPELREQYREAIADLEARYADLEDVPVGGAEAFARERGHGSGARSPVHGGRRRPAAGTSSSKAKSSPRGRHDKTPASAQGKAKPIPGITPGARRSPAQRRAAKGQPTPRVDRAIRETGIPSAVSSGKSTVMAALGATVGLSLLYLLLASAETPGSGAAALPRVIGWDRKHGHVHESAGILGFLGRFFDPHRDIFPSTAPHVGPVAGAQPVRVTAPRGEVNRVERRASRRAGPHSIPGEATPKATGDLANPSAELMPQPRHRRRRR